MNNNINFKASIISAITEVIFTHPIDNAKTVFQNNPNANYKDILKNPYNGLSSRLYGIIPMRIIFWNSLDFFQKKGFNSVSSGVLTSIIQTSVDYPIEQIKTQKIINNKPFYLSFKNISILKSGFTHLGRNAIFATTFNGVIQRDRKSLYYGAIGGFFGSLISHPFDSLKTWYQSGNHNYPNHWTFQDYMRGWNYRCSLSLISMNIGWIVYSRLK